MHTTKKLFYENQYTSEFESVVLLCIPVDGCYHILLEATAFYPEGGGQPADTGSISDAKVLDVYEKDGGIFHITDKPLSEGTEIFGRVNITRRFSLMQQHTGEHIVSGLVYKLYGYENVGFHMSAESESDFTTMDINGELTTEQLTELERLANIAVYENKPVHSGYPDTSNLQYRSKKPLKGDIRIVTVEGYDKCACCGLHCKTTGEVGVIKLVQVQKYKSGMRFYMLCGMRAFYDYNCKNSDIYELSQIFSTKTAEVLDAVKKCRDENAELRRRISEIRFNALKAKAEDAGCCMFEEDITPDEQRRLCVLLCERNPVAAVFSGAESMYRYAIGSQGLDVRELGKQINTQLNGKGGGKKNLIQGTVNANRKMIDEFVKANIL